MSFHPLRRMPSMTRWLALAVVTTAATPFVLADSNPIQGTVNFESAHVHPLDLTPNGETLLAVNTAAHSLEVFDVRGSAPIHVASIPVGLDPVSVRARTNDEAWVVNQVSDSVSVVRLSELLVVKTLQTDNEPADVVFAGSPLRAFVSASEANRINVFDALNPDGRLQVAIEGEEPRALAVSPDGSTVYAGIFESGNRTTSVAGGGSVLAQNVVSRPEGPYAGQNPPPNDGTNFNPPINPTITTPPVAMIVRKNDQGQWMDDNGGDWSLFVSGTMAPLTQRAVGWDLLDHDVAVIDADTLQVSYQTSLMNIVMALDVNPLTGEVGAVGTDATNEIRFEPNLNGVFLRVHYARFQAGASSSISDLNPHLDYSSSSVPERMRRKSLGDPRGIAYTADGLQAFVTGMGSNNVAAMDADGSRVTKFSVGEGPTGIVLDDAASRGFVLNKFAGSISTIDLVALEQTSEVAFFDPTPKAIQKGRPFLYNTHLTSGLGMVSCASCHVDARTDRLAWDLGNPAGEMTTVPGRGFEVSASPMKGPMLTQTLQDIMGHTRLHWRGDREDLAAFQPAFGSLMGAVGAISTSQMEAFGEFLATIHIPPNPYRAIDGTRPDTVILANGQTYTTDDFLGLRGSNNFGNNCLSCHLNNGSRNNVADQELSQVFFAPGYAPFYKRFGYWPELATGSTTGFGFFHDGADNIEGAARVTTAESQRKFVAELVSLEGPSGPLVGGEIRQDAHAGVGQQITIDSDSGSAEQDRLNELIAIADTSPHVALVAKSSLLTRVHGFMYLGGDRFQSDIPGRVVTLAWLLQTAQNHNPVTFTLVVKGTERRIGIDRDLDGHLDGE